MTVKSDLIHYDPKTGQAFSIQGPANSGQLAAMKHAHKANTQQATKTNNLNKVHKGGAVRGKDSAFGPGQKSTKAQFMLSQASTMHAGQKASPAELKANDPNSGLSTDGKATVIMSGGKRRRKTKSHRIRKSKKRRGKKRFRKGGNSKPWGCYRGGKKSHRHKKGRKSRRKH